MSGAPGFELEEAQPRRRGRPKGALGKRSRDLAGYIQAMGSTPGEQAAKVALVSRAELRAAGGDLMAALVAKAKSLAHQLGCKPAEAWAMLSRERSELMAYVHQRQPQAVNVTGQGMAPAVLIVGTEAPGAPMLLDDDIDVEFQVVSSPLPAEVSRSKSHEGELPLLDQPLRQDSAAPEE